jgi:formate hydrogenlyase transcriptional activator
MGGATPEISAHAQFLFEQLFENSPDAILVTNPDGRITRANTQVELIFGYSRDELVGQLIEILIPERFRQIHPAHRNSYNAQPRPMGTGLELFGRRKDGSEFPVDIMISPVQTAAGRLVLSVIRDISEKKQAEDALRRSERQLRSLFEFSPDAIVVTNRK